MLSTEVQRIVLLVSLAATGYLLILAWNADYGQRNGVIEFSPEPDSEITAPRAPTDRPTDVPGSDIAMTRDTDVPDPSLLDVPTAPAQPAVQESRLIKVVTPMLELWIDRLGGDIVRVQLPRFMLQRDSNVPYLLLNRGDGHVYVAQSGLIGPDGVDAGGERPLYDSPQSDYRLRGQSPLLVTLTAERDGMIVTKEFEFAPDDYLVQVRHQVENGSDRPIQAGMFAQIKRDDREAFGETPFTLGPQPYLGAAVTTDDTRYKKLAFKDLAAEEFRTTVDGGWIGFLQHYFLSAWVGNPDHSNRYYGQRHADGTYIVGYTSPLSSVAAGGVGRWESRFYAGPKDQKRLEQIAPNLNLTVDYGFLWWLAIPLFHILDWMHSLFGNWGVAIIMLTFVVKLALYPLSAASYRSMANMRRVAPQMKRLQERHADDRQKLSQEMMALYKKEKVNPLGGCLPMLLPMPIFIALYWVLFESVELRHAPFFLWINDLSAMDPYFILPLLMGASMYAQQLMSPAMGDPMQQRMMRMMPIMFTVLFLFFPAGLVLYWLVNNVLSIAQQYYVMRQVEGKQAAKT